MLRAYALADLFEANLDETAEGIFLTTTGGNLIGLSPHMPPALSKRLSVLGALTWRFHAASMPGFNTSVGTSAASSYGGVTMAQPGAANTIAAADPNDRAHPLTVLKKVAGGPGQGLRELSIDFNGRVCAMEYVREGLLVGAVSSVVGEKARGVEEMNGNAIEDRGDDDAEDASSRRGSEVDEAQAERDRTKQKDRLVRLLSLKANAMADYLRDEIKDFRMPTGLE